MISYIFCFIRLLEHIQALAERFDETEYIILAGTRLIQYNPRQHLVHLDKVNYILQILDNTWFI